ncbi:MAG: hypothetical protein QOF55_343 [Thermoleophilaceae bacterium]|nr:hypothetical protein [Thermoleophilaceae bacterium]
MERTNAQHTARRLAQGVDSFRGPLLPTGRRDPGLPRSLERWVGFAMIVAAHGIERRYAREIKELGISLRDFVVLAEIEQRAGLSQTALADRVGLTRARVSEQLAVLDQAGYIQRELDELDLRRRRLWVGREGHVILDEARQRVTEVDDAWLRTLGRQNRPFFTSALRNLTLVLTGAERRR